MVEQRRPPKEKVITPPLNSPWESYLFKHFTPLATMTGANLGNTKLTKAKRSLEKIFGLPTGKMLSSEQLIEIHAGKTSLLIAYLTRNQSRIVRTLAPDVLSRELIRAKKLWPAWQEELLAYIHEDKRLSEKQRNLIPLHKRIHEYAHPQTEQTSRRHKPQVKSLEAPQTQKPQTPPRKRLPAKKAPSEVLVAL